MYHLWYTENCFDYSDVYLRIVCMKWNETQVIGFNHYMHMD